jgi:TrmH family RNA methyltransferase
MDFRLQLSKNQAKTFRRLKEKSVREELKLYAAEGEKVCSELLNCTLKPEFIIVKSSCSPFAGQLAYKFYDTGVMVYTADSKTFSQISDTKTPQDIIAVIRILDNPPSPKGNFIALDGVTDPGNVGTIIRTAEWFGFRDIILNNNCVDKYNSKVVRATMGAFFRCNIHETDNLKELFKSNYSKFDTYAAILDGESKLEDCKPKNSFALIFGSESHGISKDILSIVRHKFTITGKGDGESLNVAVSAGIALNHFKKFT